MNYECPCCKNYDGITYKKLRCQYAYKMTDDIVNTYAHKEALKIAKEKYTRENDMFNEYYLMHYRIIYDGMFNVAFGEFEEHYIANAIERFQGDKNNTCHTFQQRICQYEKTGCALYRGGIYDLHHQQYYPELESALDANHKANHNLTPQ